MQEKIHTYTRAHSCINTHTDMHPCKLTCA